MTENRGVLYSFRRCPYAIRARMAIAVAGVDPEIREVRLRDKPPEMLEASPKGTVPVLVLPDGDVLEESLDIMDWALARADPEGWLARRDDLSLETLLGRCDGGFKVALDHYKYPERFPGEPVDGARERGLDFVARLADTLHSRGFLHGDRPGFHDAAIFPFVRQFAAVDRVWFEATASPPSREWWRRMLDHPTFVRVTKKLPPWRRGDPPLHFRRALVSIADLANASP